MSKKYNHLKRRTKYKLSDFEAEEERRTKGTPKRKKLSSDKKAAVSCTPKITSLGEFKISKYLDKCNIPYIREMEFETCINPVTNKKLRFDFYIPSINTLIEFDGRQHHKLLNGVSLENFHSQLYRDDLKNKWCCDNKISLVRIPYFKLSKIEDIIDTLLG